MHGIGIVIVLIIIFILLVALSFYVVTVYNKLKSYKNEVDKLWDILRIKIENQFEFIDTKYSLIQYANKDILRNLIDKYKLLAYTEDVMKSYIELERIVDELPNNEIKVRFLEVDNEINGIKAEYNNVLLNYNNTVTIMTNKIIAEAFKFKPGTYFISKE